MHKPSCLWIKCGVLGVMLGAVLAAPAEAHPDPWITAKLKLSILTREDVNGTRVKVDTVLGTVTVYGSVPTAEQKARVEAIARRIHGVQNVRNLLQVTPAEQEKEVSDEALQEQIQQAFQADPSLKSTNIAAQWVSRGAVLLGGQARILSARLRAVEVAGAVPGVSQVRSVVQSADLLADAEVWRASAPHKADDGYGLWGAASDIWITSDVRMRLLADSRLPGLDINLDTWDGVVALFGDAPSEEAKAAAEADARAVDGVKRVVNELRVLAAGAAPDEELKREVRKALEEHEFESIIAEVKSGVVRLTGTVISGIRILEAASVARSVPGVRAVETDLRLASAER